MKSMSTTEMKKITGGGTYIANCRFCTFSKKATYTGEYGGLSWSTAKVLCEGVVRNHEIEVHYDDLRRR